MAMHHQLLAEFPLVEEDRPLDASLRQLIGQIQQRQWQLYP